MDVLSSQALVAGYRAALAAAERLPGLVPDVHDRRRDRPGRPRSWCSGPASPGCGHRDRPSAGRGDLRLRRPAVVGRGGAEPGRDLPAARARRPQDGCRRCTPGSSPTSSSPRNERCWLEHIGRLRRGHHHRGGAGSACAAAGHRRDGRADATRVRRSSTSPPRRAATASSPGPARRSSTPASLVHGPLERRERGLPARQRAVLPQRRSTWCLLMTKDGAFAPDVDDEVLAGCCVTRGGRLVHPAGPRGAR